MGAKPRPELIGPVLSRVHDTLLDTVRMGFLHASRTRGRIPTVLQKAAEVRYIGHSTGPDDSVTLLRFEVPEFGKVARELFQQGQLWDSGPRPDQTAFDLLAESLSDVRAMARDSVRFDRALLNRFASYRHLLRRGLTEIGLPDAKISRPQTIDAGLTAAAQSLSRETPPSRRVRIAGRLDLLAVSKRVLGVVLSDGTLVTGLWTAESFVNLAGFLDRQVVIEGLAQFRPSGALLRVDADAIREAQPADAVFSFLPFPEVRRNYQSEAASIRSAGSSQKPYAAIFGLIPSDETDEEFGAAVDALS